MPKVNTRISRLIAVAVVVIALTAASAWQLWFSDPHLASYQDERPDGSIVEMPRSPCAKSVLRKFSGDKAASEDRCRKAEEHRLAISGLVQAIRAADASDAQVVIARQAIWMSFIQTVGSLAALIAASAAAWYAHLAFDHERRRSALAERPWLKIAVEPVSGWTIEGDKELNAGRSQKGDADAGMKAGAGGTVDRGKRKITCRVLLENVGQCIAQNVILSLRLYSGADKQALDNAIAAARRETAAPLARDEDRTNILHTDAVTVERCVPGTVEKRKHIYLLACASYGLPDGSKGFSWQAFRLRRTAADGTECEILFTDADVPLQDIVFQPRGWTGAE